MKLHPNYIKALEDHYKDFSYSETIQMIKKNRLYVASSSKYTIQSLPKDRVWVSDLDLEKFGWDAFDIKVLLTNSNEEFEHDSESIDGLWVSPEKANLYIKNWNNDDWWEDEKNNRKLEKIEENFQASIGEKYKGVIYNHLIDISSLTMNDGDLKSIVNSIEDKSDFEDKLKNKEIEIPFFEHNLIEEPSPDIRIYFLEISNENNQKIEIITFIKDYVGKGNLNDGTLEIEPIFGEICGHLKNTGEKDVKFINPFNGKWENILLECYDTSSYRESFENYNYTHHLSDDNFDFSKDFPEEDKLNKALKLHLENIKKYGKE